MKDWDSVKLTAAGNIEKYGNDHMEYRLVKPLQPPVDKVPSVVGGAELLFLL